MTIDPFEGVKRAKVNGTTLAYREQGEGEPVVFLHGGISDLRVWDQQLPAVGQSYRAVSYSRRYARPNEDIAPGEPDPWDPHVDDVAAFLQEIGAAPAHLVGNSQGAFICLLTALRHPEVVRSLVLEEPPVISLFLSVPPRPMEILRLFMTRPRTAIALLGFVNGTLGPVKQALERDDDEEALRLFLISVLGKEFHERLPEESLERTRENFSTLRAFILNDVEFPKLVDDDVRGIRVPALLLTGEHSPPSLLRMTDRLEELLPNVERVEIPDASHGMHEDNPPATNEAILGFLGRHR
jgi:pimeloyl-ACP methyl ester carboxylesterase